MGETRFGLNALISLILLISLVLFIGIIFEFHGITLIAELVIAVILIIGLLMTLIGIFNNTNFGYIFSAFIFSAIILNLIIARLFAQPKSNLMITLVLSLVGFIISLSSIRNRQAMAMPEEMMKKETMPKIETYTAGKFVASKTGSSYHKADCDWAKKIKEENKIGFNSKKEAEKEGYKAHSCLK